MVELKNILDEVRQEVDSIVKNLGYYISDELVVTYEELEGLGKEEVSVKLNKLEKGFRVTYEQYVKGVNKGLSEVLKKAKEQGIKEGYKGNDLEDYVADEKSEYLTLEAKKAVSKRLAKGVDKYQEKVKSYVEGGYDFYGYIEGDDDCELGVVVKEIGGKKLRVIKGYHEQGSLRFSTKVYNCKGYKETRLSYIKDKDEYEEGGTMYGFFNVK